MTEQKFYTETGVIAYCSNFRELKTVYGFGRALRAYYSRCRYTVRLWLLRESAIIRILTENYEKIPQKTFTRFLISAFARSARLRNMNARFERKIQNQFMLNN